MLLSYNSDIFNILRLDIIILWGKMGIIRWSYCSTLSNSCIWNTKNKKKTTIKIRGSPVLRLVKKKIPPWLSSCAQVLSWPHFCDLNHVISVALDKSHERYFIPINNLKSCVAGVRAMSSVWFSGRSLPQISFLSWNSLSRVVEAGCIQLVWEKLMDDPATLGCWTSVKSVQAMLLRCLKLQSRADKPAGEHAYRRTLSQGARQTLIRG